MLVCVCLYNRTIKTNLGLCHLGISWSVLPNKQDDNRNYMSEIIIQLVAAFLSHLTE